MAGAYKYRPQYTQNTIGPLVGPETLAERVAREILRIVIDATLRDAAIIASQHDRAAAEAIADIETRVLVNRFYDQRVKNLFQAAIDAAVRAEREACAVECDAYAINFSSDIDSAEEIAMQLSATIRARGEAKVEP